MDYSLQVDLTDPKKMRESPADARNLPLESP